MYRTYYLTAALVAAGLTGAARADDSVVRPANLPPQVGYAKVCPPAPPIYPGPLCLPGSMTPRGVPLMPGTPLSSTPPGAGQPPGLPDTAPPQTPLTPTPPDNPTPQPSTPPNTTPQSGTPSSGADSQGPSLASAAGTSGYRSAIPAVFGDQFGGGGIAGPLPKRVLNGQFIGPAPVVILPNGQRVTLNNPGGQWTPTDELLLGRPATLPANTPGGQTVGLLPPPGAVFAPELAAAVSRIPQVVYGPFKVTENENPRPTSRAYVNYYFYDNLFKDFGGPLTPRITLHQEVLGMEYAFADRQFSIGVRLPYNQISGPSGFNDTRLGNLTIITKGVIAEDRATGNLLSGGLVVTAPTSSPAFGSTITGEKINPTLLQPYVGYILRRDDWFLQGFSSLTVPTDGRDITWLSNDLALGYLLYQAPGNALSSFTPVFEAHVNTPLNHRGKQVEPIGFVDTVTLLGGGHFGIYDRSTLGFAVGAPITGPRPFSLQVTVQLGILF